MYHLKKEKESKVIHDNADSFFCNTTALIITTNTETSIVNASPNQKENMHNCYSEVFCEMFISHFWKEMRVSVLKL